MTIQGVVDHGTIWHNYDRLVQIYFLVLAPENPPELLLVEEGAVLLTCGGTY